MQITVFSLVFFINCSKVCACFPEQTAASILRLTESNSGGCCSNNWDESRNQTAKDELRRDACSSVQQRRRSEVVTVNVTRKTL